MPRWIIALVVASTLFACAANESTSTSGAATTSMPPTTTVPSSIEAARPSTDEITGLLETHPLDPIDLEVLQPDLDEREVGTVRLWTYGGYFTGDVDFTYVFEPDGDVLEIESGDIYAGPSSYTTWNVGPAGYEQLIEALGRFDGAPRGALEPGTAGRNFALNSSGGGLDVDIRGLDADSSLLSEEDVALRQNLIKMLDGFRTMSWLDAEVTERRPWVPTNLSLKVRASRDARYYDTEDVVWPFDSSVADMAIGPIEPESHVCLSGRNAAIAWNALLFDGVNNARMPVVDGERAYEVGLFITYPDYHSFGDPCPPTTSIEPSAFKGQGDPLDDLLFETGDLGPGWQSTGVRPAPPVPVFDACPVPGLSAAATRTFDSTIRRQIELTSAELSIHQLVGEVDPDQADIDAVIADIGPYLDCEMPFADRGIIEFSSAEITGLPDLVTSGAYWSFRYGERYRSIVDIALDSRVTMVIAVDGSSPLSLDDMRPWIELAAAEFAGHDGAGAVN